MTLVIGVSIMLPVLGAVAWGFWRAARAYLKFRGRCVVTCPEIGQAAAVVLASGHIAATAAFRRLRLRLHRCSRWPERQRCEQACLRQILEAPEACFVVTILSKWYEDKTCACCGRSVGQIAGWKHKPCLMSPDLRIVEWKDVQAENIPRVLTTHAPVCRTCFVAETQTS